jgi:hypothetical protein
VTPTEEVTTHEWQGLVTKKAAAAARARIDIDDLRAATFGTLLALATRHNLRLPRSIDGRVHPVDWHALSLDFEADSDVDAWAELLDLGPARNLGDEMVWREATRSSVAPVWLGWNAVYLRCYPFHRVPTAAQVAAALLTPNADVAQQAETREPAEAALVLSDQAVRA